jgi:hypothetical protein
MAIFLRLLVIGEREELPIPWKRSGCKCGRLEGDAEVKGKKERFEPQTPLSSVGVVGASRI